MSIDKSILDEIEDEQSSVEEVVLDVTANPIRKIADVLKLTKSEIDFDKLDKKYLASAVLAHYFIPDNTNVETFNKLLEEDPENAFLVFTYITTNFNSSLISKIANEKPLTEILRAFLIYSAYKKDTTETTKTQSPTLQYVAHDFTSLLAAQKLLTRFPEIKEHSDRVNTPTCLRDLLFYVLISKQYQKISGDSLGNLEAKNLNLGQEINEQLKKISSNYSSFYQLNDFLKEETNLREGLFYPMGKYFFGSYRKREKKIKELKEKAIEELFGKPLKEYEQAVCLAELISKKLVKLLFAKKSVFEEFTKDKAKIDAETPSFIKLWEEIKVSFYAQKESNENSKAPIIVIDFQNLNYQGYKRVCEEFTLELNETELRNFNEIKIRIEKERELDKLISSNEYAERKLMFQRIEKHLSYIYS